MARKSVDRSQVSSATAIPHINGLTQWGGWGILLGLSLKCQTGYIAKNGPDVRITILHGKKNKESVYVFNCEDPDKVLRDSELYQEGKAPHFQNEQRI